MRTGVKLPAALALACVLGLALLLAAAYWVGPLPRTDLAALNGLEALRGPMATPVLTAIVHTADPLPLAVMLLAVAGAGVALGRRRQAVVAVAVVVGANMAAQILKVALAHPRLHPVLDSIHVWTTAFPSGHATAAMSIALAAVIVSPSQLRQRVAFAATLYALAVGASLPIIGWHYPSDVLGGFLVAAAFAFGAVAVARALAGREEPLPRPGRIALPSPVMLLSALAVAALVTLGRYEDLVGFARDHTSGAAVLVALVSASGLLVGGASRLADR
jgi:membrane-associated phospholipid phosphatase